MKSISDTRMNSIRVAYENWADGKRFEELLALLRKHPCGIAQVALFTSSVHTPLPLQELRRRADAMRPRFRELAREGYSGGVNILATIGHHNEDLDGCLQGAYRRMTNIRGEVCRGSFCMNDAAYLAEYVVPAYTALAEAGPEFIWVDDDIRFGHMPVGNGCFCGGCISDFNARYGTDYTRESLREALNAGDVSLRKKWLERNGAVVENLLRTAAEAVKAVSPQIAMGFMTGERWMESYDFPAFAAALSCGGKKEILWRPGGGAYEDRCPDDFFAKAQEIGRQTAYLPDYAASVQSEIENFPYQLLKKSPASTAAEAALYMTAGCTGAALNILPSESLEPIASAEPHLEAVDRMTPFYSLLNRHLRGLKPEGIHSGWSPDGLASAPAGEWTEANGADCAAYARELFAFGLPEAFDESRASAWTLSGGEPRGFSREKTLRILSGGVCLDAGALDCLNDLGYGEYTGFREGRSIPRDALERYEAHPVNEGFEGGLRNCRQAFHPGPSYELIPASDRCETLCGLRDYHGGKLAECSMGLFRNSLGGLVCAAGYYPFAWISDTRKALQLKRIFARLSGGKLPSFAENYIRVRNATLTGGGKLCVTLFNPNPEALENTAVWVRGDNPAAKAYGADCREQILSCAGEQTICGNLYRRFVVPAVRPFEMELMVL